MRFGDFLDAEWRPALGCTEPAAIAYAACSAAALTSGPVVKVHLACDPRMYKNCYAVGIPHSGHRSGIRWAAAIGSLLPDPRARLECFRQITPTVLALAGRLLDERAVTVDVDPSKRHLYVDCTVERTGGTGRTVIEGDHTRVVRRERDGRGVEVPAAEPAVDPDALRAALSGLTLAELVALAGSLEPGDRDALRRGAALNLAIARHGVGLFPERFASRPPHETPAGRAGRLVCAGVHARMSGEDFLVMSVAGSGNKGIVCSVPLMVLGEAVRGAQERVDEALALAALLTVVATHRLGTLSAACGCSNAAGIGLAAGLVRFEGGGPEEISLALNNMVGNIAGMVCDGAKIGCALKTMTAVDAAFRASTLAMCGVGIPATDGIVAANGLASITNLGRIATRGMISVDEEVLRIMKEKL